MKLVQIAFAAALGVTCVAIFATSKTLCCTPIDQASRDRVFCELPLTLAPMDTAKQEHGVQPVALRVLSQPG